MLESVLGTFHKIPEYAKSYVSDIYGNFLGEFEIAYSCLVSAYVISCGDGRIYSGVNISLLRDAIEADIQEIFK